MSTDPMRALVEPGLDSVVRLLRLMPPEYLDAIKAVACLLNVHAAITDQSLRAVFDQAIELATQGEEE